MPIGATPYTPYAPGVGFNLEEELRKLQELQDQKAKPGVADAFLALGSTLSSLGSGGRIPNNAAEIMERGRKAAQENYERQLELEQRKQALRYIAKTGNAELMAAYQAGMDPGQIIGFNFQEKMADKRREWELEDRQATQTFELDKLKKTQEWQAANDPATLRAQEEAARIEKINRTLFPGLFKNEPSNTPVPVGDQTKTPTPTPPPSQDLSPIPTFSTASQEAELPVVDQLTEQARAAFQRPDLTPSDARLAIAVMNKNPEKLVDLFNAIDIRNLREQELHKGVNVPPNTTGIDPVTGKKIYETGPAPEPLPADIRTAEYLKAHPELSKTYMDMKRAGSNVQTPDAAALTEAYKTIAEKTVPKLIDRGRVIGTAGPQYASLEKLIETVPAGMTLDAWIAQNVSGYSGQADAFKSIVLNLAPQTKVEGSGSQSDVEYAGALAQFPKITGTREGNRAILSIIKAKNQVELDQATAASEYLQTGDMQTFLTKLEAINKRSILADVPDEVKALVQQGVKASEEVTGESTPRSKAAEAAGMTQEQWDSLTPAQRQEIGD